MITLFTGDFAIARAQSMTTRANGSGALNGLQSGSSLARQPRVHQPLEHDDEVRCEECLALLLHARVAMTPFGAAAEPSAVFAIGRPMFPEVLFGAPEQANEPGRVCFGATAHRNPARS